MTDIIQRIALVAALMLGLSTPIQAADTIDETAVLAYLRAHPDFITKHPDIVETAQKIQSLNSALAERRKVSDILASENALITDPLVPTLLPLGGGAKGDIHIIEFSDYVCGPCRASFPHIERMLAGHPNVRMTVLPFPLFGANAELAARAGFAANLQGKFKAFHWALMSSHEYVGRTLVMQVAKDIGLDVPRLQKDMSDPRYDALVAKVRNAADRLNIKGPPTFVIGGTIVRGGVVLADLETVISFEQCLLAAKDQSACAAQAVAAQSIQ